MHKITLFLILFVFSIFSVSCFSSEQEPGEILKTSASKYKSLETYSSEGSVVVDATNNGKEKRFEASFSIKLKKPNLYLISMKQEIGTPKEVVVWNSGKGPYLYSSFLKAYSKVDDDAQALRIGGGITIGLSPTIPSLFLSGFGDGKGLFGKNSGLALSKIEKVGEDDCFVVNGVNDLKEETLWISKENYLIKKYVEKIDSNNLPSTAPKFSDEKIREILKLMKKEITDENIKEERKFLEGAYNIAKSKNFCSVKTEIQVKIYVAPKFTDQDFQFTPPPDTVLKNTPLDSSRF